MSEELNDQLAVRREKMQQLRDQGMDPFGKRFDRLAYTEELLERWDQFSKE